MSAPSRGQLTWGQRVIVALAPLFLHLLFATWRVRVINDGPWRARRQRGERYIFAFWHGEMLPLLMQHRGEGVAILISEHRDGELIAQIIERAGLRTVRGSTSRGAARALLAMVRALATGIDLGVTPDGPRGPAHSFAPGALVAAHRAGVPIVPISVQASPVWRARSWDAFTVPKPFARIVIAYGDPSYVEATDARGAAEQSGYFQDLMQAIETVAHSALYSSAGLSPKV